MATPDQPGTIERPTRARYIVLALLCAMAFVLYLDRICMGQAVKPIRDTLDISKFRMGLILAAFTVAYGIFEIPAGHWGDRYGSRRVLARIVICWSLFTALTGASFDFWSLLAVRFLFGAGEAGAFPNAARIFQRWFPPSERGRGQGLMLASSMIGASIAPAVAGELINAVGWRWMFVIFSATGIAWAAVFFWWFHDDPREHPSVNVAEVAEIGIGAAACREHPPIPWRAVATNRNIWLLGTIISLSAFNSYLYFSWYPEYLEAARGLTNRAAGYQSALVLLGGAVGTLGGGFISDRVTRTALDPPRTRRWYGVTAYFVAASLLVAAILSDSPLLTSLFAGASCAAMLSQQAIWWNCACQLGGRHVGAMFGLMNGMGMVGAIATQVFFGTFAEWRENEGYLGRDQWDPAFIAYIGTLALAGIGWMFVDVRRNIEGEEET